MAFTVLLITIFGLAIGVLGFFIIKLVVSPKRLSNIADMVKQGRYPAASRAARVLISREQDNYAAHYYLGLVYLGENKPELALMEFKTVNQIGRFDNDVPERAFRKQIATLYERFGQLEEALKEFILLTKLEPDVAEHYYDAGRIFEDRGKTEVAVKYLRKALDLDQRNGSAHYMLGVILYKTKHSVEAKSEIEFALKYSPDNYEAFYYLGKILKDNNDNTAALLAFEKAQKSPDFKLKALVERGGCYMSMGAFDKAIVELERSIKLIKDEGSMESLYGRYFLAMCFEKTRNLDKAIEQWEKIYQKKPQFRDVADKLQQYQEYRTDDRMKDFLSCTKTEFVELCRNVTLQALSFAVRDIMETANGVDFITVENDSEKWMGTKKLPQLLRYLRVSEGLDDSSIRSLLEAMKKLNIFKGSIIANVNFTRSAMEFAENRPVELFPKEKLQELLLKTSLQEPSAKHR